ncbi:MAG TPA: FixH family protein [Phnomibacter sp.]|nr:FixH family protein [Phnomibacter sp.]
MTIKWNWGTKIFLVYGIFVVAMLTLVYMCTRQQLDLVSTDYYAQELKFQQVIDGRKNATELNGEFTLQATHDSLIVQLPTDAVAGKGEIFFYRPDNASFDVTIPFENTTTIAIPSSQIKTGTYKVKASWKHNDKPFYQEKMFTVQ